VLEKERLRKNVRPAWAVLTYHARFNRPDKRANSFLLSMLFAPQDDVCWSVMVVAFISNEVVLIDVGKKKFLMVQFYVS